jgi:hypothetical protein
MFGKKGLINSGASVWPRKIFAVAFIDSVGLVFINLLTANENLRITYWIAPT